MNELSMAQRVEQVHPLLRGLVETFPPAGALWETERQEHWLATARGIFQMLYVSHLKETQP